MRECGECQECCTQVGVADLDKAPGERCINQCDMGCAIYPKRPNSCRAFECLWLQGDIDWKPIDTGQVTWAEPMDGHLGQLGLQVLKSVSKGEPHQETVDWLMEQPVPVLLNDVWYMKGEKVERLVN